MELYELSAVELGEKLRSKEVTATEITKSVLMRAEDTEGSVGAYITLTEDRAIETAQKVDAKIAAGEEIAPLAGIPISIKDNICTKGVRTTAASKILYNFAPPYNATVVEKLETQLMPMVGKTNMDEFAMGSSCETSHYQKTYNPRDLTRVPGGSSGGSAASVAAGSAVVSLGSDTGGSIRQPASYCGVVGLKPTYGSVSRYGLIAFASSLDQIGPFGRTVTDTAMVFDAIYGKDKKDATSVNSTYENLLKGLETPLPKGTKIGVPKEYFGAGVEDEVKEAIRKAAAIYKDAGIELVEISLPMTSYALNAYYIIACAEASSNLARFDGVKYGYRTENYTDLDELYRHTRSEGFGDEVKRRIMLGTFVLSSGYIDAYYKKAREIQRQLRKEFADAFGQVDLILTPTTPDTAFTMGERSEDPIKMYATDLCTVTVNLAGLPGISIPSGLAQNGMPIGLQLTAPWFEEERLLRAARFYEKETGGFPGVAKV